MMTTETVAPVEIADAELVAHSLSGSRDAFGQIVARYQSLICSLAFSSSGSLTQSEDLAQETFVAAWQHLAGLREPAKLRSWLCGIVRNLSHRSRRGETREPAHGAEPLEALAELPALEPCPPEQAISREEEGLLWQSLERVPETYREPLILYYREQESIERVALALELSEDAVRQRLVRGRKLLQEQVLALVEGTLKKTSPGRKFTLGVLAALPATATTSKAAALGAGLVTGGAAAKSAATLGALGGLAGLFAMLGAAYTSLRAEADDTKSPRERRFFQQMVGVRMGCFFSFLSPGFPSRIGVLFRHRSRAIFRGPPWFFSYTLWEWGCSLTAVVAGGRFRWRIKHFWPPNGQRPGRERIFRRMLPAPMKIGI